MLEELIEELVRQGLMGTDRTRASARYDQLIETYGIQEEEDADRLLQAVATVHLLHKGAQEWARWEGEVPHAPKDMDGQPCSQRSWLHLRAILDGHHAPALPEFLSLAQQYQRRLPPAALPTILDYALSDAAFRPQLKSLLGPRGWWLIGQHDKWAAMYPDQAKVEDWQVAPELEQPALLEHFREVSPVIARQQLQGIWQALTPKQKAKLLPALTVQLSTDDEDFLELCLDDKRKEVRVAAAEVLAQLPESKLVQRLFEQALGCLRIERKKLIVVLPDELPEASKRDGIYPTGSKQPGGLRLNWLMQILAKVPLQKWLDHWQIEARILLGAWWQSDDRYQIFSALGNSLLRYSHDEGLGALLEFWINKGEERLWNNVVAKQLLEQAPSALFNRLLVRWLEQQGAIVPAETLPAYWLQNGKQNWERSLSKIIIQGFQDQAGSAFAQHWQMYHYRGILEAAAYRTDPQLLEELRSTWSAGFGASGRWQPDIEKLLQTLRFRQMMHSEIQRSD